MIFYSTQIVYKGKCFLNLFSSSVHVTPNFATAINCFFTSSEIKVRSHIMFFSLLCGVFV